MNNNNFDNKGVIWFLSKRYFMIKKYAITLLICLIVIPNLYSQNYYVTPNASGSGNGTISNPWTIYQAAANAQAGDIVFIDKGIYALNAVLSFNNNGTATNPIVFRGVRVNEDEKTADGTNNTFLRQDNSTSGGQISIGGSYVTLDNMVIRQQYPRYLITIGGSNVTLDSVVTQYPSDVSSGGNHTIVTSADYTTLRYCYFWQGPRTIVWVKPSYPNTCDHFLMEYTTISGFNNHYAIQLMPVTQTTPVPKVTNATIRNCIFRDGGYESSLYIRNVYNCKIYNNLFINSLGRYGDINLYITDGINVEAGYDAASIFANNTIYSTLVGGSGIKSAGTILFYGLSNQNGWTVKNNLVTVADGILPYRYDCLSTTPAGQDFSIDNNFIYVWNKSVSSMSNTFPLVSSTSSTSYTWANWKSQRGFDTHTIIDVAPTFINLSGENYRPLSNSPQIGKGTDLSSWGITTDYDGNPRDPNNPTVGAFEYITGGVDITAPRVTGAFFVNSSTVRVSFSEPIALPGAVDPSNYSINNGISVNSVSYSGNQATLTTNAQTTGSYTVTVNNVTDIAGNLITSANNKAQYNVLLDVTPPQLVGAGLIDSVTLNLTFSEALDPSSGQNLNNYSISGGISVIRTILSGSQVTLTTSIHVPGNYTVTVNNIKDLTGNLISSSANSSVYVMVQNPQQGSIQLPIVNATASVVPEPLHTANKTVDGLTYSDGDPDSRWAGDSMPEWLQFDLGSAKQISLLKLSFYNWNGGRTYKYSIQVSTDMNQWTEVLTNVSSSLAEWTDDQFNNIKARYVKVVFISSNQNGWAGLWEAEIWGPSSTTDSGDGGNLNLDMDYSLSQNYPNPFNPETKISFTIPKEGVVQLTVYNILGEEVSTLINELMLAGKHEVSFNAQGLSSGVYIYKLQSSGFTQTKKMMIMK